MQGRDTGSEAYLRAAQSVADQFKSDGLKPVGDGGTFFQAVPMHQVDLDTGHSSVELVSPDGSYAPLALLYEVTLRPSAGLPAKTEGSLIFIGYGMPPAGVDLHGKIAVYFNNIPASKSGPERESFLEQRRRVLGQSGALATVAIDNPSDIEPAHWPAAYARTVTLRTRSQPAVPSGPLALRISAEAAPKLFAGSNADSKRLLANGEKGADLATIPLARTLRISLTLSEKDISSPNVVAVLPGSDPALAPEYVSLSAHLDGYGFGTPVIGDNLYNGALDDAAYVATLLELASNLSAAPKDIPKRSLLFCIFTGEEKGLLGSVYFTQHPTVPVPQIVANLNLDQLRPIFPLRILTMEGINDSTLGQTARTVARQFSIELRPDHETERHLFSRADNYSFVRVGIPIASFIFGYDPGTPEERIYRDWYARRYHKPQDDLATPIDWEAAVTFNNFYRALALAVANDPKRPEWILTSPYAPRAGVHPAQ
jgi:Zn-dependent M28 family amino/carboxypeptidase